jgi:hypothetical protein
MGAGREEGGRSKCKSNEASASPGLKRATDPFHVKPEHEHADTTQRCPSRVLRGRTQNTLTYQLYGYSQIGGTDTAHNRARPGKGNND